MTHLFLDTNIIIDFLADRRPFSVDAARIFDYAEKGKTKLYLAAVSYNNVYYIISKHTSHNKTIKILKELEELTITIDTTAHSIKSALNSEFRDFEDAIQYFSSMANNKIDGIVTRNASDFKISEIPVWTPHQAIQYIDSSGK